MLSQSLSHGGSYKKSHTFDYKHGTAIERDPSASRSTSRQGNNIKVLPPRAAHVIRGYSNYGNFLRDEQEEPGMQQRSTSSLRQNSTDSWEGAGRESSLSMVSDYTLSYGVEALEPQQLVQNNDGRFVPAYVALDRKVLRFHAWFRDSRGAVGFKVRKATLFHYLEDGSTRVSEKRVENSGIVTGEIARRHRVPKKEGGYYTVEAPCLPPSTRTPTSCSKTRASRTASSTSTARSCASTAPGRTTSPTERRPSTCSTTSWWTILLR